MADNTVFCFTSPDQDPYTFRAPNEEAAAAHIKKRFAHYKTGDLKPVGPEDSPRVWTDPADRKAIEKELAKRDQ